LRSPVVTITTSKITALLAGFYIDSRYGTGIKIGELVIRGYLPGIEHAHQIRRLHDLNSDILHVPDIGPVHLF
jgi:hypothetical protein